MSSNCLILSLIIACPFSNLLYEHTNVKFTVNAFFYYITTIKASRQRLIFWVFVAHEFVTDNGIIIIIMQNVLV